MDKTLWAVVVKETGVVVFEMLPFKLCVFLSKADAQDYIKVFDKQQTNPNYVGMYEVAKFVRNL